MNGETPLDPRELREVAARAADWIASYWEKLDGLPVTPGIKPGEVLARLPAEAPEAPEPWDRVFEDLDRVIVPGLTHWQSPRFFAYFPANISTPSVVGELLSAGVGVQGMLWLTSPACTELETRVLDWMARLTGLPGCFLSTSAGKDGGGGGGVIQGTASEATLVALVAGRDRARRTLRARGDDGPLHDRLVCYASTQAHSSVVKAAMIAGLAEGPDDRRRVRLIETDAGLAMDPAALARAMRADVAAGLVPCFVCATAGTTSTTAVDPVDRVAEAVAGCGAPAPVWLHVDAAHAGAACVCPEYRWMWRGVERADSVCFNPHKWLLTNFDCDCFFTSDRASLVRSLSVSPAYLANAASESGAVDYRDWQVPLGRRFRALKLWLVLRVFGAERLRAYIREHVRLAGLFEELVRGDGRFEVAAERTMNLVCFRLRVPGKEASDRANKALMDGANAGGRVFLTHTVIPAEGVDRLTLRLAVGATLTREADVREAWSVLSGLAAGVPRGA